VWAFEIGSTNVTGPADNGWGIHQADNGTLYSTGDFYGNADFDPGFPVLSLSGDNKGHAYVASYGTALTVGLKTEQGKQSISIYPVPSSREVVVENGRGTQSPWSFKVTDATGRKVLEVQDVKISTYIITKGTLSPGVYYCEVISKNETLLKKIVLH
jgi:hypothetical protein